MEGLAAVWCLLVYRVNDILYLNRRPHSYYVLKDGLDQLNGVHLFLGRIASRAMETEIYYISLLDIISPTENKWKKSSWYIWGCYAFESCWVLTICDLCAF